MSSREAKAKLQERIEQSRDIVSVFFIRSTTALALDLTCDLERSMMRLDRTGPAEWLKYGY